MRGPRFVLLGPSASSREWLGFSTCPKMYGQRVQFSMKPNVEIFYGHHQRKYTSGTISSVTIKFPSSYEQPIMHDHSTVTILLVEDDEIDAEAFVRSFKRQRIANPVRVAKDGIEALELLRGDGEHEPLAKPYMILLDLNMPRMNGIEFLKEIRSDSLLCKAVVFILTTSESDRDILSAYENQVAGYMVKSRVGDDFMNVTSMLDHYWRVIELPS